jgi:phosphomannomutase
MKYKGQESMEKETIKFGTDGWRGIISEDFTMDRVRIVSAGVGNYLKKNIKGREPVVAVGFDTRFLSDRFAAAAAEIFSLNGIRVILSSEITPTPVLSHAVVDRKADLGIMITASHNPYYYNGYKIKGSFGGSATMDIITDIEKEVRKLIFSPGPDSSTETEERGGNYKIKRDSFKNAYVEHVLKQVDTDLIKGFKFGLLFEPMYGAAQKIYRDILSGFNPKKLLMIHSTINPGFGGINPEPIEINLKEAVNFLKQEKCQFGICLDGDGDRIGALGEGGSYISSHHIFAIVLRDLVRRKGIKGRVVKTVNVSSIVDRICKKNGLELDVTPVGFKYIGEKIVEGNVIMAGEESGGLWSYGNIPERDGMLMGLKLLEIICSEKKTINRILEDLYKEYGFFDYRRTDYSMGVREKQKLVKILERGIPETLKAGGVKNAVTIDGYKYHLDENNWVMIRLSGTEAVARVYSEGESAAKSVYLQQLGRNIINSISN